MGKLKELFKKLKKKKLSNKNEILEKLCNKYPQLKFITEPSKVLEINSKLEATKWQKVSSIFAIILVIITGIYASLVYQSNYIISSQFKTENMPQLTITNEEINMIDVGEGMIIILPIKNLGKTSAKIERIIIQSGIDWNNLEKEYQYNNSNEISWKIFPQETKKIMLPPKDLFKGMQESQLKILRIRINYSGEEIFSEEIFYYDTGNIIWGPKII